MTSPNGITWELQTVPTHGWNSICWSGTQFCAIGTQEGYALAITNPTGVESTFLITTAGDVTANSFTGAGDNLTISGVTIEDTLATVTGIFDGTAGINVAYLESDGGAVYSDGGGDFHLGGFLSVGGGFSSDGGLIGSDGSGDLYVIGNTTLVSCQIESDFTIHAFSFDSQPGPAALGFNTGGSSTNILLDDGDASGLTLFGNSLANAALYDGGGNLTGPVGEWLISDTGTVSFDSGAFTSDGSGNVTAVSYTGDVGACTVGGLDLNDIFSGIDTIAALSVGSINVDFILGSFIGDGSAITIGSNSLSGLFDGSASLNVGTVTLDSVIMSAIYGTGSGGVPLTDGSSSGIAAFQSDGSLAQATAAQIGTASNFHVMLTTDASVTGTTMIASPLSVTLPAGTYRFQSQLNFATASTTAGMFANLSAATGDVGCCSTLEGVNNATWTASNVSTGSLSGLNIIELNSTGSATSHSSISSGMITVASTHTYTVLIKQQVNDASNPSLLKAGSFILFERIG